MATPKPGEIRCPTCHRSTPPAAFCTQCGSAIPPDARIRPRGMDRDELQERIRARRSGGEPYRRGSLADEVPGYERYEPEPEDERARARRAAAGRRPDHFSEPAPVAPPTPPQASAPDRADLTRDRDEREPSHPATAPPPPAAPPATAARAAAPPPAPTPVAPPPEEVEQADAAYAGHYDNFDDEAYQDAEYPYEYDTWDDGRERRSGAGALALLGFLALGVLALLGGAMLAGINGGDGVAEATPSPTALVEDTPPADATPSPDATAAATPVGTDGPAATDEPVTFPDGFSAEAQPCLPGSAGQNGCDSNGAINSGATDIWIGFSGGSAEDVVGATLLNAEGQQLSEGSIELSSIGCGTDCTGYTRFNFANLPVGQYTVEVTRNGQLADRVTFEVQ